MTSTAANQSHEAVDEALKPADFPYRVLLSAPESRHIPHFVLIAESKLGRVRTTVISNKETQSRLVSGNLFRSLRARYGSTSTLTYVGGLRSELRSTRPGRHFQMLLKRRASLRQILNMG